MLAGALQEINENVEERINLQKALFELEDINVCNQYELQNIEDMLTAGAAAAMLAAWLTAAGSCLGVAHLVVWAVLHIVRWTTGCSAAQKLASAAACTGCHASASVDVMSSLCRGGIIALASSRVLAAVQVAQPALRRLQRRVSGAACC